MKKNKDPRHIAKAIKKRRDANKRNKQSRKVK